MSEISSSVLDLASRSFERRLCPNCGARGLDSFFAVDRIPVHSCLLMPTRAEALAFPRGDLRLAHCATCGFVTNPLFDPEVHSYSSRYEETQGFSGLFSGFLTDLAKRMIDTYGLEGKTVLEIGCGKGEFVSLLAERGKMKGIGIDPAYVPARRPAGAADRVEFIRDFYSEEYAHLSADFICCRHTLEHIGPTLGFMKTLRASIGDRRDTVVFFEVPDVLRELREGAFWDIYYEHCSYFSPGSLARLFRATGFTILELDLDFDGQYILLVAKPTDRPSAPSLPLEDDREEIADLVAAFPGIVGEKLTGWRSRIDGIVRGGGRIAVWGAGSKCVAFMTTLGLGDEISHVVDINPHKHGYHVPGTGHQVVLPRALATEKPDHVIVMNPVYAEEIGRELSEMGVSAEVLSV